MSDSTPRPPHTTMAAGMVIGGSVLVVLTAAQQLSTLNSLDTREAVSDFLAGSPGGLDVTQALVLFRISLMVVAGCATAAAVLGYHVLRRSKGARLGLSLLAVPLFLGGLATGGFVTSLVAASAMLLWVGPSRAWLDRTPLPEPPGGDPSRRPAWPPPLGGPTEPPARPSGSPPAARPGVPPPHGETFGTAAPHQAHPPLPPPPWSTPPERRPDAVVWACVLAWALSGLLLALLGASLTLLATDSSLVWEELQRQDPELVASSGLTQDDLARTVVAALAVGAAWCLLALVLAVLAFRRVPAGRLGLVVSAALASVVCLAGSVGAVVLVLPACACLATVVLLSRPDVRGWYAGRPPRP